MIRPSSNIVFTPVVKKMQEKFGSRKGYAKMEERGGFQMEITPDLADFVAQRDSFYLGTSNLDGQPYIQHRGGPKGFLKVLDHHTLGFADYAGNKQYITAATLSENNKAYIFLMDYPKRRRIKVWGTARVVEDDPEHMEQLVDSEYGARIERAIIFEVKAWDSNCPQHITPRFTEGEMDSFVGGYKQRIAYLEEENMKLKEQLKVRS